MGKEVSAADVGDIELDSARLEPQGTLKVYGTGMPAGNRAVTIQDEFITLATPPDITSAVDLERARRQIIEKLRADTFNHFPWLPPKLAVEEEYALDAGTGTRFAFTSEEGWRLHGVRRNPASRISIAARGEMAAVALYAALLDGRITTIFLESPPATEDAASQKNGRGPAIEMLNCLRYTDLAHVAGLLHPAEIVLSGEIAPTYD